MTLWSLLPTCFMLSSAFSRCVTKNCCIQKCTKITEELRNTSITYGLASQAPQASLVIKNPPANAGDIRGKFHPWVRKIPWRREWQPIPLFLPGESHGQTSLVGYSPRGRKELEMAEATEHTDRLTYRWFNVSTIKTLRFSRSSC